MFKQTEKFIFHLNPTGNATVERVSPQDEARRRLMASVLRAAGSKYIKQPECALNKESYPQMRHFIFTHSRLIKQNKKLDQSALHIWAAATLPKFQNSTEKMIRIDSWNAGRWLMLAKILMSKGNNPRLLTHHFFAHLSTR